MSDQSCFVIMPFAKEFDDIYKNVIKTSVENFGITCRRADEIYLPTPIYKDICEHIEKAKFLIADLTGRNANVNYELGLAHALQKPVIILSQLINDVPVDFRNLRVIVYSKRDLHGQLGNVLQLTIDSLLKAENLQPVYSFKNPFIEEKNILLKHLQEIYIQSHYRMSQSNIEESILFPVKKEFENIFVQIQNDPDEKNNKKLLHPILKDHNYVIKHCFMKEKGFVSGFGFKIFK